MTNEKEIFEEHYSVDVYKQKEASFLTEGARPADPPHLLHKFHTHFLEFTLLVGFQPVQ